MKLRLNNILVIIIFLIIFAILIGTLLTNYKENEFRKLIKSNSEKTVKEELIFNNLEIVIQNYINDIKEQNFKKLDNVSKYYAKDNYKSLSNKIDLNNIQEINLIVGYVLNDDIYKCDIDIITKDNKNIECNMCIKLNIEQGYFYILDIEV